MNWAHTTRASRDEVEKNREFFQEFFEAFRRQYPRRMRDFALYQKVADQIIGAAERQGPDAVAATQDYIYRHLVQPLGGHLERNDVGHAVRRLIQVVKNLARRFNVALPSMPELDRVYADPAAAQAKGQTGLVPIPAHIAERLRGKLAHAA